MRVWSTPLGGSQSRRARKLHGMPDSEALDAPNAANGPVTMPDEFEPRKLARRTLQIVAVFVVVGLVLLFAPGLGQVRHLLTEARPEWVALAVAFEALSCVSYVLMFGPIFCPSMPGGTSWEIGGVGAGRGLARARERRRRARARRLDPAPGGHAGGADRPPLGRVLPDQELGQLRRRRGARHGRWRSAWSGPDLSLLADRAPGRARDARDRRGVGVPRLGPGGARARPTLRGCAAALRRACAALVGGHAPRRWRSCARGTCRVLAGVARLLGLRQRRALGDVPRLRPTRPRSR